jgi:hypothetical protein
VNSINGTQGSMGAVFVMPTTDPNHPHWKTATMTPYAAPIDSRFMIAALTGTGR